MLILKRQGTKFFIGYNRFFSHIRKYIFEDLNQKDDKNHSFERALLLGNVIAAHFAIVP